MSRRDLKRMIKEIREARGPLSREEEERAMRGRLRLAIMDEESKLIAPGFRRAKDPADRVLPPEAKRLWGEDYTAEQVLERLDGFMSTPMGNAGDLTPYAEYMTPEDRARLCEEAVRQLDEMGKYIRGGR